MRVDKSGNNEGEFFLKEFSRELLKLTSYGTIGRNFRYALPVTVSDELPNGPQRRTKKKKKRRQLEGGRIPNHPVGSLEYRRTSAFFGPHST
ncbi:hypothetical protein TNCV_2617971 [Trichonephila clavipes]|nr:hypothetical protein TNCV_2617971 [Trichonephila clavipes]